MTGGIEGTIRNHFEGSQRDEDRTQEAIIASLRTIKHREWYETARIRELFGELAGSISKDGPSLFRRDREGKTEALGAYIIGHVMNTCNIADHVLGCINLINIAEEARPVTKAYTKFLDYCDGLVELVETQDGMDEVLYPKAVVAVDERYAKSAADAKAEKKQKQEPEEKVWGSRFLDFLYVKANHSEKALGLLEMFLLPIGLVMKENFNVSYFGSKKFRRDCERERADTTNTFGTGHLTNLSKMLFTIGWKAIKSYIYGDEMDRKKITEIYERYNRVV